MNTFDDAIDTIDRTVSLEALREARELVLALEPTTKEQEWRRDLRRVILCSPLEHDNEWALPLDERTVALERLAVSAEAFPDDAERAWIETLRVDLGRRRRDAAFARLDAIEARIGRTARIVAYRARLHMAFDERAEAKQILDEAVATHPGHYVDSAYATLHYVVADFDNAELYARRLEGTRFAVDGADLRVSIAASRGDLRGELDAITRAIEIAPQSENLAGRFAYRALVSASLDDLDGARADLERALDMARPEVDEDFAVYLRHRLDAIDAALPETKHRRLEAFPTVLQKWNYCGPAVIELCLRYLGIEMTQDLIAEAVKQGEGTPMLSIVAFLREQGLEARRVEATPERLRAAIDLGVPVILEDDYSNTLHVTVAMGYDDRLGVLLVADPMTHAPRRQGIESRAALAGDHRFGGIAVLGRTDEVTAELRSALDEAGLIEREHIALLDEISRVRDDISPGFSSTSPLEAGGWARAALALEPRFARAAVIEANALLSGENSSDAAITSTIAAARSRFPELSEFASLASRWNEQRRFGATSLGESVLASILDVANAQPRVAVAWALTTEGDRRLAYRYANDAFVRAPANPAATLALARVAVDDVIDRARAAGELGSAEAAFLLAPPEDAAFPLELDRETVVALAGRLTEAAVDMAPGDGAGLLARGDYHLVCGELTRARERYEAAISEAPSWATPRLRLAHVLEAQGDPEACDTALHIIDANTMSPEGWSAALELIARCGTAAQVVDATAAALDNGVQPRLPLNIAFPGLSRLYRSQPEAARALAALATARAADAKVLYAVTDVLKSRGLAGYSVDLLRARLLEAPHDAQAHFTLASILSTSPAFEEEALLHAESAHELAPWAPATSEQLGWMIVESDPNRAIALAEPYGDEYVGLLELHRVALVERSRTYPAGDVETQQAAAAGSAQRALWSVAIDHLQSARYSRVAQMDVDIEPRWDDVDDVDDWLTIQYYSGHVRRAVALIEGHPEVAQHRRIAGFLANLGPGVGADLIAAACRRAATFEKDAERAVELEVRARLALRDFDGIEAIAGENVAALVACAEAGFEAQARLHFARLAADVAPDDRNVLAALHAALFDNGHTDEAGKVARQLDADYPFHHQGPERLAETEALAGDPQAGVGLAAAAVIGAPYCSRAHTAYAVAAAVAGEWELAARHASEAAQWNTDSPEVAGAGPDRLVAAAAEGDAEAYGVALASLRGMAPLAETGRLERACAERISELAMSAAPAPAGVDPATEDEPSVS